MCGYDNRGGQLLSLSFVCNFYLFVRYYNMEGQTTYDKILKKHPKIDFPNFPEINDAVVGVTDDLKLIYSEEKTIEIFMKNHEWSHEEALEWYCHNVECCHIGPRTPVFESEFEEELD